MIAKSQLRNFPPRKARTSARLIKFLISTLMAFSPFNVSLPKSSCYQLSRLYELLVLTAVTQSSISQKSRDLRGRSLNSPAGETVLRWCKRPTLEALVTHQNKQFKTFVERLPAPFQHVRKQGMVLALDCHTDPNYGKVNTPYIIKGRNKASTHRAFWYMTLLWVNAPEPITLGIKLLTNPRHIYQESQALLAPWLQTEHITRILADGDYYNWDLVHWLQSKGVAFIIRGRINHGVKPLVAAYQDELQAMNTGIVVPYVMKKGPNKIPWPVKLVLWRDHKALLAFILPPTSQLSAREARELYRDRFTIETYYRMMHRFQPCSCSQHPNIRYILVSLAFWLCNLWCYFKAPLKSIKKTSHRVMADKTYPANLFCESIYESWLVSIR